MKKYVMMLALVMMTLPSLSFADELVLERLQCIETEDWTGADDADLVVGGEHVWSGKMNNGQTVSLNIRRPMTGNVRIELYEIDSSMWGDEKDYLGSITVSSSLKGMGSQTGGFTEDDANYKLHYHVK